MLALLNSLVHLSCDHTPLNQGEVTEIKGWQTEGCFRDIAVTPLPHEVDISTGETRSDDGLVTHAILQT